MLRARRTNLYAPPRSAVPQAAGSSEVAFWLHNFKPSDPESRRLSAPIRELFD